MSEQGIIYKINLVRNPKTGKGWVFNLSNDTFMRALNPTFAKNRVVIEGYYQLENNKFYLVKEDRSSWKNNHEHYQLLAVQNNQVNVIAEWWRENNTYNFEKNKQLEQLFLEFNMTTQEKNVINFAKYIIQKVRKNE